MAPGIAGLFVPAPIGSPHGTLMTSKVGAQLDDRALLPRLAIQPGIAELLLAKSSG